MEILWQKNGEKYSSDSNAIEEEVEKLATGDTSERVDQKRFQEIIKDEKTFIHSI
jgi:hypothetical protein